MTDGLVTALEKDGYPSREACLADSELERVAADCDLLFTTMARFASPEVKREVLAVLLRERLGAVVNWNGDVLATLRHYEAEVGRLEEARKEVAAERHWLMEQEAREAPFAALGRKWFDDSDRQGFSEALTAARAALAEEKAKEPEWSEAAPSKYRYRVKAGTLYAKCETGVPEVALEVVRVEDAAFVAALLKGVTP